MPSSWNDYDEEDAGLADALAEERRACLPGCPHRGCHHLNVKEGAGGFGECQDCGEEVV